MSALKKVLIGVVIISLLLVIAGSVMFGVYHKSTKHEEVGKIGLYTLITGSVLTVLSVIAVIVVHHNGKKSHKQSHKKSGNTRIDPSGNTSNNTDDSTDDSS
jgi:uncharacterized membrane protein